MELIMEQAMEPQQKQDQELIHELELLMRMDWCPPGVPAPRLYRTKNWRGLGGDASFTRAQEHGYWED